MLNLSDCSIGIEFGSTRIKAVLIGENFETLASGCFDWENRYENGLWTYSYDDIMGGMRAAYKQLKEDIRTKYGIVLRKIGAIGISAMMHGYVVLGADDKLLVPFRTWRNNNAEEASEKLTELFKFHIPARWSIAHLYQAILSGEEHVKDIKYQTTLAGYVHYLLTWQKVMGIGEASGMFPIDQNSGTYDGDMIALFDDLCKGKYPWKLKDILPKVIKAGGNAGCLTQSGALLLDPEGDLQAGIPFCPPEGDAGTGMVATNSVKAGTGNVSAGTSVFSMIVLRQNLKNVYPEIDIVTTPDGLPVAMVHCNNCSSEINTYVNLFSEVASLFGVKTEKDEVYKKLFKKSQEGDRDCGGVVVYNYLSGENITNIAKGRPMTVRITDSNFSLANVMRAQLYSAFATLKIGNDILIKSEGVTVEKLYAHGGLFKTEGVCQSYLASALNAPITVTETAGEGGAWGMAVLARFLLDGGELGEYLQNRVFAGQKEQAVKPDEEDAKGFERYIKRFKDGLPAELAAGNVEV